MIVAGFGGIMAAHATAGSFARPTSTSASSLVTPAAARSVLTAMWSVRETALHADDVTALERVDTGAARDRDVGLTLYARGLGISTGHVRRPLGQSVVVVPYQTRFPVSFLAFVATSAEFSPQSGAETRPGYATDLLVFTKAAASQPWRVALETQHIGGFGFTAPSGSAYAPAAPSSGWVSATGALQALAQFDDQSVEESSSPSAIPMAAGPWTTGPLSAFANEGPNGATDGGTVLRVHTYGVSAADGIYHFDAMGVDLVCGAVTATGVLTPAHTGGYLLQNATRTNWGGWLAPGAYRAIHTSELNQVCLSIPSERYQGIAVVSGEYVLDEWTATGTRL